MIVGVGRSLGLVRDGLGYAFWVSATIGLCQIPQNDCLPVADDTCVRSKIPALLP